MHSLCLVHGDLKCHNIAIDAQDNAKLLDVCSGGMTHGYFWPSDADNESLSPSFDIYSLGVVFWVLSDGDTPQFRRPPVVSGSNCPQGYAELVRKCVAESSNDRPSISNVIAEIIDIEEGFRRRCADDI
jgi:serine/threonine protein kinase